MTTCDEFGNKHYSVTSGSIYFPPILYENPEPGYEYCCWGQYLAKDASQAKVMAYKDKEFQPWVREQRGDGKNPFSGMKAVRFICEHGTCLGCNEVCPTCEIEYAYELG